MSRPEPLARALKSALRGLDLEQRLRESRVMAIWPEIVGEVTASKTRPLHVNRGVLVVRVVSSTWAHQLSLLKPRLLSSIAERVGPGVIRDLRWKTGSLDDPLEPEDLGPRPRPAGRQPVDETPLPAEEQAAIARLSAGVEDARLNESLKRLLAANARRRRRLREAGWQACQRCGCLHDPAAEQTPGPLAGARLCPVCRLELARLVEP